MNFLIPVLSRYSGILIQFALVTLIARELIIDSAGVYFVLAGLVYTLNFLTGFGLPDGLVAACPPELAAGRHSLVRKMLLQSMKITLPSALLLSAALGIATYYIYGSLIISKYSAIWLLGYCLTFASSQQLMALGQVRSGSFTFYSAANFCVCISTIPYLLISEAPSIETVLAITSTASLGAGIASTVYAFNLVRRLPTETETAELRAIWINGSAMGAGRLVQAAIIWMPVWIAGMILTKSETAHIGLASRLFNALAAVLAAVRFSVRPQIARLAAEGHWRQIELLAQKIAFWTTLLSVAALLAVATIGSSMIPEIFGDQYSAVVTLLVVMLGANVAESLSGPVDEILKMTGSAKFVLAYQFAILLFSIASGMILANVLGGVGVSLSFCLSFIFLYMILISHLYRTKRIISLPLTFRS